MLKSIEIILKLLEWWFVDWHQKNAQKQRDEAESNPAGWFSEHFGGGVRNSTQPKDKTDNTDSNH